MIDVLLVHILCIMLVGSQIKLSLDQSCSLSIIHFPDATVYNVMLITLCLKVSKDNTNKNIFYIKVCMTMHSV